MKKLTLSIILIIITTTIFAQNYNFKWAKSSGGMGNDYGESIVTDSNNNVYLTGGFQGTVDFDPGVGVFNLTASSGMNTFIQKLDSNGNFVWAKLIPSSIGFNKANSLVIDTYNNLCFVGYYNGTTDFDPGNSTYNLTPIGTSFNCFILKLNLNGDFVWAKSIEAEGKAIASDISGNILVAGNYEGTVDFDPGNSVFNMTSIGGTGGDCFILKLDLNGNFIWAKSLGGIGTEEISSITTDDLGNVYTTGWFKHNVDFDPGASTFILNNGSTADFFIQKLDSNGSFVFAKSFGNSYDNLSSDVKVDAIGNIYMTGYFVGTVDFDPNAGVFNMSSVNSWSQTADVFVLKLNSTGDFLWANSVRSSGQNTGKSIVVDTSSVYVVGYGSGTLNFQSSYSVYRGFTDIFIQKMDTSGSFIWAKLTDSPTSGSHFSTYNLTITKDVKGNIYIGGSYRNTVDFDPNATIFNLTSQGVEDCFILKLGECTAPYTGTNVITACQSYLWIDGNTYTSSNNTATFIKPNVGGDCDSLLTLDLTILLPDTSVSNINICPGSSFTFFDGYSVSSVDTNLSHVSMLTGQSANGCDSLILENIILFQEPNANIGPDTLWVCDGEELAFGLDDTTGITSYSISNFSITQNNDSLIFIYNMMTPPSSVVSQVTDTNGCVNNDQVFIENNNINFLAMGFPSLNDPFVDFTIANMPSNVDFWYWSFGDGDTLSGNVAPTHEYLSNGFYEACLIAENICGADSSCVTFTISAVGVAENTVNNNITIYPNPVKNQLTITAENEKISNIKMMDVTGKIISIANEITQNTTTINVADLAKGLYILQIQTEKGMSVKRFIKE